MSDVVDVGWDIDNIGNVFPTGGRSRHITENIDPNGHRTFVVEFTFDTGVLILEQTAHDENLDHVFLIKFFQDGELKCTFWGLLEMETDENQKRFTVTSQDMHTCDRSTTDGIDVLRQILPEERICQNVLDRERVGHYADDDDDDDEDDAEDDDEDDADDDDEGGYAEDEDEEQSDPAQNLAGRFADAAGDAEGYDYDGDLFADVVDDTSGQV